MKLGSVQVFIADGTGYEVVVWTGRVAETPNGPQPQVEHHYVESWERVLEVINKAHAEVAAERARHTTGIEIPNGGGIVPGRPN